MRRRRSPIVPAPDPASPTTPSGSTVAEPTRHPRTTALIGLYRSYGAAGRQAWIDASGTSMRPLVEPGGRLLVDFGATPSRIGEVVLFERANHIVAHRIVGSRRRDGREQLLVKGDAEAYFDPPIGREDVLGVVREVSMGPTLSTSRHGLDGRSSRLIARVSRWTGRAARVARRVARHSPGPVRGAALRAIPTLARVPTRLIVAPMTQINGVERR
jgi:hypothetical protein